MKEEKRNAEEEDGKRGKDQYVRVATGVARQKRCERGESKRGEASRGEWQRGAE